MSKDIAAMHVTVKVAINKYSFPVCYKHRTTNKNLESPSVHLLNGCSTTEVWRNSRGEQSYSRLIYDIRRRDC